MLVSAAVHFTSELEKFVSVRRIEAAWKHTRKVGGDRAQHGEPAYSDAQAIHVWMEQRFEHGPPIGEILDLNLQQLAMLSPSI